MGLGLRLQVNSTAQWETDLDQDGTKNNRGYLDIIEGSLEVKLPTIWTDGKAEVGRVREEKRREEKRTRENKREDQRRERVRSKKMQTREKVDKSRNTALF